MRVIQTIFSFMSLKEKTFLGLSVLIRLSLVGLDLGGLILIGGAVSLVSGTRINVSSPTGTLVGVMTQLGLQNPYAGLGVLAMTFFIVKALLSVGLNYVLAVYVSKVEALKATNLFRLTLGKRIDQVERWSSREFSHAVIGSTQNAFGTSLATVSIFIGEIALILTVSIYLALVNLQLLLFSSLYLAMIAFLMGRLLNRPVSRLAAQADAAAVDAQTISGEAFENFRQIRANDAAESFIQRFSERRSKLSRTSAIISVLSVTPRYAMETAMMLGIGILVIQRSITSESGPSAATIAVFLAGIFRIVGSMVTAQGSFTSVLQLGKNSRLALDLATSLDLRGGWVTAPHDNISSSVRAGVGITICNLAYTFPGATKPTLSALNLAIQPNEYVVIKGASGAGKSTLADIMLGLREPQIGTIEYFDTLGNVVQHPRLAYVPQETRLFSASLQENIAMTFLPETIDQQRLQHAVEAASLLDLIRDLPRGLETRLLTDGQTLSGGQTQRIGLARAFYRVPDLLVMDESTSALDPITEDQIINAISEFRGKVTIVMISHGDRLSTQADRTIEVRRGGTVRQVGQEG